MMKIALHAEWRRFRALYRSYRLSVFGTPLSLAFAFLLLTAIFRNMAGEQGVVYGQQAQLASLIGVFFWHVCMGSLGVLPAMIQQEANEGTLESLFVSVRSFPRQLVARTVFVVLQQLIEATVIVALPLLLLRLPIIFSPDAILLFLITLLGAIGIGFGLCGLVLVYKSIGQLTGLIVSLSLFVSGALVPLDTLPTLFNILKLLLPTSWGIHLTRQAMFGEAVGWLDVTGLMTQSVVFLIVGVVTLVWGVRQAKRIGGLKGY